jgi:RimJ/RimL family protein N-acetyltransferase
MVVYGRDTEVANWVAARWGAPAPAVNSALGFERDGELIAGVYFDGLTDNNIFAHVACDDGMPVPLLRAVAQYVYQHIGLERMTYAVSAGNLKAIAFVTALGATKEAQLRRACGDHDLLLFALWRTDPFAQRMLSRSH